MSIRERTKMCHCTESAYREQSITSCTASILTNVTKLLRPKLIISNSRVNSLSTLLFECSLILALTPSQHFHIAHKIYAKLWIFNTYT